MVLIIHSFSCLMDVMLIIYMQKYLMGRLFHLKMWIVWTAATLAGVIGGYMDTLFVVEEQITNLGIFFIKLFFPVFLILVFEKDSLFKRIEDYVFSLLLYMAAEAFCLMIELFIFTPVFGDTNNEFRFLLLRGCAFLLFIAALWWFGRNKVNKITLTMWERIILFIANILTYFLLIGAGATQGVLITSAISQEFSITILGYSAIFLYAFFIVSLINGRVAAHFRQVELISREHMEDQLRYFKSYKQAQEDTRRFRHDMKNHLLYLQALSSENKIEEVNNYLQSLNDKWEELPRLYSTGNDVIDTILNAKSFMYEDYHIKVSVNGEFSTDIKMKTIDLCTIISNALDNAINANAKLSPQINRYIDIALMANRNYHLIKISNPVEKEVEVKNNQVINDEPRDGHGYGLGNIGRAIKLYGGYTKINSLPDVFILEIVFPQ